MITRTITTTSDGNNLIWNNAGGGGNLLFGTATVAIPVQDCDQVNLLCTPTKGGGETGSLFLSAQWAGDTTPKRFVLDAFITSTQAGVQNSFAPLQNRWGPWDFTANPLLGAVAILLPAVAHFLEITVSVGNAITSAATQFQIDLECIRTNPTQQP